MPDRSVTTKLIATAARERLHPLGLRQKGRSRLWFEDRGQWLNLVEFTASRMDGTFLVVAAMWLWHQPVVWSFDYGGRVFWRRDATFCQQPLSGETGWTDHLDFITADQFTGDLAMLADIAGQRVVQLQTRFPDPTTTARTLAASPTRLDESPWWHAYHAGAAAGLSGDSEVAREQFARIAPGGLEPDWAHDLAHQARHLAELAERPAQLQQHLLDLIQAKRLRLGLPPLSPSQFVELTRP